MIVIHVLFFGSASNVLIAIIAIRAFVVPPATTPAVAVDVVVVVLAGMVGVCVCARVFMFVPLVFVILVAVVDADPTTIVAAEVVDVVDAVVGVVVSVIMS